MLFCMACGLILIRQGMLDCISVWQIGGHIFLKTCRTSHAPHLSNESRMYRWTIIRDSQWIRRLVGSPHTSQNVSVIDKSQPKISSPLHTASYRLSGKIFTVRDEELFLATEHLKRYLFIIHWDVFSLALALGICTNVETTVFVNTSTLGSLSRKPD